MQWFWRRCHLRQMLTVHRWMEDGKCRCFSNSSWSMKVLGWSKVPCFRKIRHIIISLFSGCSRDVCTLNKGYWWSKYAKYFNFLELNEYISQFTINIKMYCNQSWLLQISKKKFKHLSPIYNYVKPMYLEFYI